MSGKNINAKPLLLRLSHGEKLDSPTLELLHRVGYITVEDATNEDSPAGQRELVFKSITETGKRVLGEP